MSWLGKALVKFRDDFELAEQEPGVVAKLFLILQLEDALARSVCESLMGKALTERIFSKQASVARYARSAAKKDAARRTSSQQMAQSTFLLEPAAWMRLLGFFDLCLGADRPADRERQRQTAIMAYVRDARIFTEFRRGLPSEFVPLAVDLFLLRNQRSANLRHIVSSLEAPASEEEEDGPPQAFDTDALYEYLFSFEPSSQELYRRDLERLFRLISTDDRALAKEMASVAIPAAKPRASAVSTEVFVYSSGEIGAHKLEHLDAFRAAVVPRAILPPLTVEWLYTAAQLQQYRELYGLVFEDSDHPAIERCREYRAMHLLSEKNDETSGAQWNAFAEYKFATIPKGLKRALVLAREFHAAVVEPNAGAAAKQKASNTTDAVKLQRYLVVYTPAWQKKWVAKHTQLGDELEHAVVAYLTKTPVLPSDAVAELKAVYFE